MTLPPLDAKDFPSFFRAMHGHNPFPWQSALVERLANGKGWPDVLDLPTGTGKTAAIDAAVFHLALEAGKGSARAAPLRIAFVVDRRLVVDDAFARAQHIAKRLSDPNQDVLEHVAARLRAYSGPGESPLIARRLRGGVPMEDDWARTPCQPTVLCSTVDQVGSRLLFRGYGVSDRMNPIHAGLLGADCLILLDEAHLAEPFRQTLEAIGRFKSGTSTPVSPWRFAQLSATPGVQSESRFQLTQVDRENLILKTRLQASKRAFLKEARSNTNDDEFVSAIVAAALDACTNDGAGNPWPAAPVIGVVLNRVAAARHAFNRLSQESKDKCDVSLLIGPARSIDRDRLNQELDAIKTGRRDVPLPKPRIIVATQCIEAGVDLDFDALITQAAPLDALRQRFGRLNRAGRKDLTARAAIIATNKDTKDADKLKRGDLDPVYGDRTNRAWALLSKLAEVSVEGKSETRSIDFGIDALAAKLAAIDSEEVSKAASEKPDAPVLMPAYVDLWTQTSPIPACDPEAALFLHGTRRAQPSVTIVWRADVEESQAGRTADVLALAPPRAAEVIEVPIWAARKWLSFVKQRGKNKAAEGDAADFSDAPEAVGEENSEPGERVFRWRGAGSERTEWISPNGLRPNDMIVVPCEFGGCDEFGWNPDSSVIVSDAGSESAAPYEGRRYVVRVHRGTILDSVIKAQSHLAKGGSEIEALSEEQLRAQADRIWRAISTSMAAVREDGVENLLKAIRELLPEPLALRQSLGRLDEARRKRGRPVLQRQFCYDTKGDEQLTGVIFIAPLGLNMTITPDEETTAPSTEDDAVGSTPGFSYSLDQHSKDVESKTRTFGSAICLSPHVATDATLAAWLHDAGKADPRFQAMLAGGNRYATPDAPVLAKSARRWSKATHDAAGLPDRWRHEALSVRIALAHPRFNKAHDPALVIWLIGTHHGYGRPFFPHSDREAQTYATELPAGALEGMPVALAPGCGPEALSFAVPNTNNQGGDEYAGLDWVQLFEGMKRKYGPWELAHLEAIVRLADHRASEDAERKALGED